MKKGIVELTDLILVNKADGDLLPAARLAQVRQACYRARLIVFLKMFYNTKVHYSYRVDGVYQCFKVP